jgi:apolipoprotein N-acyltransferase
VINNNNSKPPLYQALFASFAAGAITVAAFAPLEWATLAFVGVAALFYLVRDVSARNAFWLGWAFGYGLFGFGVSWVYVSLSTYGGMPLWMGSIAVFLFAGILGVFAGFTACTAAWLFPQGGARRLLALPFCWIIYEWLKSWVFTGLAWLEVGYTQSPTWLFSFAPIGGVYLVSFAVTFVAACLVVFICYNNKPVTVSLLASIALLTWGTNQLEWSSDSGPPLMVGIVQGNVPINQKWQSKYRDQVIEKLRSMSADLQAQQLARDPNQTQRPIDLLVWPETALPLYYQQTDQQFWQNLVSPDVALLTGLVDGPAAGESYNAAVLSCNGQQQIYRKRHLVPFGEYLPMRFLFNWVLEYLQLPMSDFSPGQQPQTLNCGDKIRIGLSICYEDAFANEVRESSGDATLLVNISEDAWFGDSLAPHQRLQMGQMRSRELSRPMVRSANSGPSSVINQRGEVLAQTPQFEPAVLVYQVQPQQGVTPFKRWGHWPIWLSLICLVAAIGARYRHVGGAKKNG